MTAAEQASHPLSRIRGIGGSGWCVARLEIFQVSVHRVLAGKFARENKKSKVSTTEKNKEQLSREFTRMNAGKQGGAPGAEAHSFLSLCGTTEAHALTLVVLGQDFSQT